MTIHFRTRENPRRWKKKQKEALNTFRIIDHCVKVRETWCSFWIKVPDEKVKLTNERHEVKYIPSQNFLLVEHRNIFSNRDKIIFSIYLIPNEIKRFVI